MDERRMNEMIQETSRVNQENRLAKLIEWQQVMTDFTAEDWEMLWKNLSKIQDEKAKLALGHACLYYVSAPDKYEQYLSELIEMKHIDWDEKYYLLWQVKGSIFSKAELQTRKIEKLGFRLYHQILKQFMGKFEKMEHVSNRNSNLIFVTVQQFLGYTHAPSKTTLDRARVLKSKLGKNVIIINTAEFCGGREIDLFVRWEKEYNENLLNEELILYEGNEFPYIQFNDNMPNLQETKDFFSLIQTYKPDYIVNIGGDSLLIDACSQLVPVLNVNTVPSALACTEATVQILGRKMTREDEELLNVIGKSKEDVIEGRFTSSLKPQTDVVTRRELGISKDAFVMVAVGVRLTTEITQEFLDTLHPALEMGAVFAIVGKMDSYQEFCSKDELFKRQSCYLGMREDVLAILDHCDLYVNPKRTGGGTSVIEAMYKGCPAVTLNQGDVSLGAGEEFCVSTYEEMRDMIVKYMTDKEFYDKMSKKARKRAEYMLDSDSAFMEIIHIFEEKIKKRQFCLADVKASDMDKIYEWANDMETRNNAFSTEHIEYSAHVRWFEDKMEDQNCIFKIYRQSDMDIGQIRVDMTGQKGIISYTVDKRYRGLGHGKNMLALMEMFIIENDIKCDRLIGRVKKENKASQKCFAYNGYQMKEYDDYIEYQKILSK